MPHRMNVAAIIAVIAFSVLVPSMSAQAADAPTEACPTLPPGGNTSVPNGPPVEQTLMRAASSDEPECEPGSLEITLPLDVMIALVEGRGYDVVEHGIIDAVIQENDALFQSNDMLVRELQLKSYGTFVLNLVILGIVTLWILDRRRLRQSNYLK